MHSAEHDPGPGRQVPSLDGLRGVAILGVLAFHTGHLSGGFLGVDLFFALSGYLITGLLLREVESTGTVALAAFWGRRARRLSPALAAMLVGVVLLVWTAGSADLMRAMLSDGPWVQWDVINWRLLSESAGYWDRFGSVRVFEHLWSIAVEEQFYLAWPVLVLLVARWGRRVDAGVALVAALGSAVSLIAMIALADPADPSRVYTGTDTRAFSLLLGALVATGPARAVLARGTGPWAGGAQLLLGIGIGTSWLLADGVNARWLFTGGLFLHSLAGALLVGLCAQAPHTVVARALAWHPVRWLGLISYSLYLWHWPILVLFREQRTALDGWAGTAVACGASVGVAAVSKYLVEDPIRFRAGWAGGRRGLAAFAVLMTGLAVLWVAVPAPAPETIDVGRLG